MKRGAVLLLLLASGCRRSPPAPPPEPQQTITGFTMSQSDLGVPAWQIKAESAVLRESAKDAALAQPRMEFYKKKKVVTRLSALSGLADTQTHDVRFSSSVVVTSLEDDSTLRTEELLYSSSKKKFLTDKDVFVKRPGGALRGKGLEASSDLSEIRIFKQRSVIEEKPR